MELFFSQYTSRGGRKCNEDSLCVTEHMVAVADGLGGQGEGDVASQACVEYLLKLAPPDTIDNESMHRIIDEVNLAVYNAKISYIKKSNMASTVVAAFVKDGRFNYLNVGDSRLYYFRKNKLLFRSKDHSITQMCVDMGEITEKQMRFHEDRNKLTKALGLDSTIKIKNVFDEIELSAGDAYLLCSDGFWEYVLEKDMEKALKNADTPQQWLDDMLKKLRKRSPENCDNRSAVCVMVK